MTDFFISYAQPDRSWAEWIAWVLEEAGYSIHLQAWDFRPGANFVLEMARAAQEADRTLAVLSPDYLSSRYALSEWSAAFAVDPSGELGRLLPVRVRHVEPSGLLAQIVYVDLVGLSETAARERLLQGLQRGRAKPSEVPAFPDSKRVFPLFPLPNPLRQLAEIPISEVPPRCPLPSGSWVPFPPFPDFVGREGALKSMARAFKKKKEGKVLLLTGEGGIGKTALAVEFVHRYGGFFAGGVFWLRCGVEESIPAEVALCGGSQGMALRPDFEELPLSNRVQLVQEAWRLSEPRLLVFDGCEDPAILRRWVPGEGGCRVLVTSRSLELEVTTPGTQFLRLTGLPPQGVELSRLLDQHLAKLDRSTRAVLESAACFPSFQAIPVDLLAAAAESAKDASGFLAALDQAETMGLIQRGAGFISLHPLTEKRLRANASTEVRAAVERAVCREAVRLNEGGQATRLLVWQGLLRSVVDQAKERWDGLAAGLCEALAEHLLQLGERKAARPYLERALQIREALGESSTLAATLENLGRIFQEMGDLVEARVAFEKALSIREKAEPRDSRALVTVLHHLGLLVRSRGGLTAARSYFERALALSAKLLGSDHPDTIAVHNQLQALLGEQLLAEQEFSRLVPWGNRLTSRLLDDGAILAGIKTVGPSRWLFRVQLPQELQESFGTAPQVVVLVAAGEVQGKDLQAAQQELQKDDLDLDPDLLIVVDDRAGLKERLDRLPLLWGQWVPWPVSGGDLPPLAGQLRRHLPLDDVFEKRDPVRGRQVIGRQEVISDLRKRLQRCEAVGVFGLRKVGKTSVVRAVTDRLDPLSAMATSPDARDDRQSSARVLWIDVERLVERSMDSLVRSLRREVEKRLGQESSGLVKRLPAPGGAEELDGLLAITLESSDLPLCIVLDEYDLLFEGSGGQPAVPGIETLFRVLRAWAQQTSRLALAVIGRDPQFFEQPELGGHSNPMLNWVVPHWLGPLPDAEADELLERLGRRVLLDVGPETRELARHWTGGHPLLHRQFGSALLELARKRMPPEGPCHTDVFREEAVDRFLARDAVITICREVSHLLASRYASAAALLEDLCWRTPGEALECIERHDGWWQPSAQTLRHFGLLLGDRRSATVPEVFRWYLRTMMPQRKDRRA